MLSEHWPLFDLRVRTPRVELRYPSDDDLAVLAGLAAEGIHPPESMPFSIPWTRAESPVLERNAMQWHWRGRAGLNADEWSLPFLVFDDGEPVGAQEVRATRFLVTRSVLTGSWIVRRHQGRGVGREMRAAILHLAFAGLGAIEAHTAAFEDNPASLAVTRALGYRPNGTQLEDREGTPARQLRFVLARDDWERRDDITIENLGPCLGLLGLDV